MALRALQPCKVCRKLARGAYCDEHRPPRHGWDRKRSNTERGYGTKHWRPIRQAVMERDEWLCQPCLSHGWYTPATEVNHLTAKADGGTDDLENLEAICRECHKLKTAQQNRNRRRRQG